MWFKNLCGVMGLILASTAIAAPALADETDDQHIYQGTPDEVLVDELYHFHKDSFDSSTLLETWRYMFGTGENNPIGRGQYFEISIERDLARANAVWKDTLVQQTESDLTIRVPDLDNPFNTSLLQMPSSQLNSRVVGSELVYERLP